MSLLPSSLTARGNGFALIMLAKSTVTAEFPGYRDSLRWTDLWGFVVNVMFLIRL
jgi:hypothetical protein